LHKSCKVKILNYLRDKHCIMSPSANPDICFDPNIAANKPTFGLIVDAIVESCFVNNENFIHVADIGMKIPIHDKIYTTENHLTGPSLIDDLFNSVKQLREHFDVQLLQVDIAFTLQYPKNHFAQISCERKKKWIQPRSIGLYSTNLSWKISPYTPLNMPEKKTKNLQSLIGVLCGYLKLIGLHLLHARS
jgi:hypothetical protein